uniref:Amino acid transporter transmembrane domain-containing protein n=1 Tax=Daucus carota subsp. sativus TaxID=79200 RepID=A0A161XZJ6_DAUCS
MTSSEKSESGLRVDYRAPLLSRIDDDVPVEKRKGASFAGSVFNLSCSIVGAGIMSLPSTFKLLGIVPGTLLVIIAAFLTEASVEMLLRFSKPGSSFSYGDVMGDAFGTSGKVLLQICIVINNIGAVIIYLIITEDVISGSTSSGIHHAGILEGWFGEFWWTGRAFVLLVLTTFVFIPLICFKRIDSLRFTSAISFVLAVLFIVVLIGVTIYKLIEGSIKTPTWFPEVDSATSFLNLFTAVPVLVCAYLCHFNVHTIENELGDSPRMQAVVRTSLVFCAAVYLTTGFFGFLLFGDSTLSDVLSNFDTNLAVPYSSLINSIVHISYALHIILIFPIIFHPLRLNLDGLLFPSARHFLSHNIRFAFISMGLLAVCLFGAIYIPSIWIAFEFAGATVGVMLLFIFPAAITLRQALPSLHICFGSKETP